MGIPRASGSDWSEREIDLIVADYFDMLRLDLAGTQYVKAERNRGLQNLTGRSQRSIEFKHQNISAVLHRLGRPWIPGYKPMRNFQRALIDGVDRHLSLIGDIPTSEVPKVALQENRQIYLEAPPPLAPAEEGEPIALTRLARKFDPALRDERNRTLGKSGEERIFESERFRLLNADRGDLATRMIWVSQDEGDGAGYDILSFDLDGRERLIEVKTTSGPQRTPFFLSENERTLAVDRPNEFRLVRLYDVYRTPRAFELIPPLEQSVLLRPINYRAEFG